MSDFQDDEFPGAPTNLEFWSLEIPPGKTVEAKITDMSGVFEIVHITGCALGEKATNDRHVIKAIPHSVDGKQQGEVALGTLAAGRTDQFALDFGISRTTGFRHTGKSSVWLSGYLTRSFASDLGSDDEYSMDEDEDEDEDEESESGSDDDEAPAAVPLIANGAPAAAAAKGNAKQAAAAAAAAAKQQDSESEEEGESDDEDEDESDDEGEGDSEEDEDEEDEDEEGDKYDRKLGAKSFDMAAAAAGGSSSEDDEDDEDEEEDEDEESGDPLDIDSEDLVAGVEYAEAAAAAGPQAMDVEASSDDEDEDEDDEDEDEDEDEEDEDEDEDEEESEEEEEAPKPAAAGKAKRPAQPMTPQPAPAGKRQKAEGGKAVAQSAPAKGPQAKTAAAAGGATPGSEAEFMKQLVAELRKGPSTLNALGSKVKRPQNAPKYKVFLSQHPGTFKVDGETVSLVKGA
uniref:Nucleoplasmin-like domain-containing protein n=1 Tax=Tetradesmus obliquus TaxID=3088 RepID=A0A383WIA0_TETOB|eukprot:jgi/Sobl393_1/2487/SZX76869.1